MNDWEKMSVFFLVMFLCVCLVGRVYVCCCAYCDDCDDDDPYFF